MTEGGSEDLTPREEIAVERSAQLADELRGATPSDEVLTARQEHEEELSLAELQIRQHETDALRAKRISGDFEERFNTQLAAAREKQAADEELSPAEQALLDRATENQARMDGLSSILDDLVAERDAHTATKDSDRIQKIADKVSAEHIEADAKDHHLKNRGVLYEAGQKLMGQDFENREAEAQRLRQELTELEEKNLREAGSYNSDVQAFVNRIAQVQRSVDSLMAEFAEEPTPQKKDALKQKRKRLESELHDKSNLEIGSIYNQHILSTKINALREKISQLEAHLHMPTKADFLKGLAERAFKERFGDDFEGVFDGPVEGVNKEVILANSFKEAIEDPSNILATVEHKGMIAGFSLAVPIGSFDPERSAESETTAYVYVTAIDPEVQDKSLIGPLSAELADKLYAAGYRYMERDAVKKDGYADNVARAYGDAIEHQEDHERHPEVGPQTFFRINLEKALK